MGTLFKHSVYFVLLLWHCSLFAQDATIVSGLLNLANSDTIFFLKRVKFAEQALKYAKLGKTPEKMMEAYLALGKIYLTNSSFDKSLFFLQKAHNIAQSLNIQEQLIETDYLLGRLNLNITNFEKAKEQFNKVIKEASAINDSVIIGEAYSSLGIVYSKQRKIDSSMIFYKKAFVIFDKLHLKKKKQPVFINIGDYFLETKQPDSALFYFNLSLQLDSIYQPRAVSITYLNIGLAYAIKQHLNKAIQYYRKSLKLSKKYSLRYVIYAGYLEMARAFESINRFDSAFYYYKYYTELKDSVYNETILKKTHQYQTFIELEKKNKELEMAKIQMENIKQKEKIARLKNYFFFFFALFVILTGLLIFWRQQTINKAKMEIMIKNRELQLVKIEKANHEIKAKKNENIRLKQELEKKKQDLLNFGLDISRKNRFFKTLKEDIKKAMNAKPENQQQILRNIFLLLQNYTRINDDLSVFQKNIEQVNQEFITKLSQTFPSLTQLEINLCGMIKIGLSIKEVAAIRNVSPKSIEMSRYRLRKKMNLPKNIDLTRFLKEF